MSSAAVNIISECAGVVADEQKNGLSVVYTPPPETPVSFDLIAVHGFDGNYLHSWTWAENGFCWLKELSREFPDVRVSSFGHEIKSFADPLMIRDAAVELVSSTFSMLDNGEQRSHKLVFVGHSVGGLLIKKALVIARQTPKFRHISTDCHGIIFFGTPHRGFTMARQSLVASKFIQPRPPTKAFKLNQKYMGDLGLDFGQMMSEYEVVSFYETVAADRGQLIVDRDNAVLNCRDEHAIPLHSNHYNLAKFTSHTDEGYQKLLLVLRKMRHSIMGFPGPRPLSRIDTDQSEDPIPVEASNRELFAAQVIPIALSREELQDKVKREFMAEAHEFYDIQQESEDEDSQYEFRPTSLSKPCVMHAISMQELFDHGPPQTKTSPGSEQPPEDLFRFRWVHVPTNNMAWVRPTILACAQNSNPDMPSPILEDKYWVFRQQKARHNAAHARFMEPSCTVIRCEYRPKLPPRGTPSLLSDPNAMAPMQFSLFLPYFHWDTQDAFSKRARFYRKILQGKNQPVPSHARSHTPRELEYNLAKAYLSPTNDYPLHPRRTLDQFFYWHLPDTASRDNDQIIAKLTDVDEYGRRIIMVDQLWLWITDDSSIFTFFPPKEEEDLQPIWKEGDIKQSILDEVRGNSFAGVSNAYEMAALVIEKTITTTLGYTSRSGAKFLEYYREAIGSAADDQTRFFQRFQATLMNYNKDPTNLQSYHDGIENKHEELQLALHVADIIDELNSISRLLDVQKDLLGLIIRSFRQVLRAGYDGSLCEEILERTGSRLEEYRLILTRMRADADHTNKAILTLLDLKQKETNIDEARISRLQAEEAANQGRSIMVFTIITIIFAPLSFFASYFGMNAIELTGEQGNITTHRAWVIMGPISVVIIISSFVIASNTFRHFVVDCHREFFKSVAKFSGMHYLWNKYASKKSKESMRKQKGRIVDKLYGERGSKGDYGDYELPMYKQD